LVSLKQFPEDWKRAVADGWKPGVDLFEIEEALKRGTIFELLVSDAAHKTVWPADQKYLKPGDALYFSHGFRLFTKTRPKSFAEKH